MGLTVRSSRCAVISMIIFGFIIFIAAAAYIAFSIIFGAFELVMTAIFSSDSILQISWYLGHPLLLALLTMITGCVGCCASSYRTRHDTCQTSTLFIFSLIVAGLSSYTIYNFSSILVISSARLLQVCKMKVFCSTVTRALEGSLLGLAILVLLLSCWAMICCIASFCCDNEIAPEPESARVVGGQHVQQGVMLQGAVMVPMMQANQPMVQANQPMMQANQPMMQANPSMVQANQPMVQANQPMMQANPSTVQAVPVMQTSQAPMSQGNQATEMQSQGIPMQVVATPVVLTAQE